MNSLVAVVIPTYNASKSIVRTIKNVLSFVPEVQVIVVDDNSPDGTADTVKKYFGTEKRVFLLTRKWKNGRGSAVLTGFKKALKDNRISFFIEMDGDLCHYPKYIPKMIKKCQEFDVVIASKYSNGSKIIGLPLKRKIFSRLVNIYIKAILGIPVNDFTNGFRCYKRSVIEYVVNNTMYSRGFIVLSESLYYIYKHGFSIGEMPFIFKFHNVNPSNFNLSEIKEAFITVLKLKLNRY